MMAAQKQGESATGGTKGAGPTFSGAVPRTYQALLVPMLFEPYARDMGGRLGVRGKSRLLELACGTGVVTRVVLGWMAPDSALVATDVSPGMLEVAREAGPADPRVEWRVVDACELPFERGAFDAIACQFGVMFFPDKERAMREARRVLKPGGTYVFNVWDSLESNPMPRTVHEVLGGMFPKDPPMFIARTPHGWFDRAEIERVVRAGGFTSCRIDEVSFPSSAPSAEMAARAWVEGTPILAMLGERGVTDTGPVVSAVARTLAERFGSRPCASTMRALVVTAS